MNKYILPMVTVFVCVLASNHGAATGEELPEERNAKSVHVSSDAVSRRDPFQTTDAMRELAKDFDQQPRRQTVETDTQVSIRLPKISIKAYIADGVQPALVLLDVEKLGTFFVRQGSLLELQIDGLPTQLVIGQLSGKGLEIELKNSGTKLLIP